MLDKGSDVACRDPYGETPLIQTSIYDNCASLRALCGLEADLHDADSDGFILHHAAVNDHPFLRLLSARLALELEQLIYTSSAATDEELMKFCYLLAKSL